MIATAQLPGKCGQKVPVIAAFKAWSKVITAAAVNSQQHSFQISAARNVPVCNCSFQARSILLTAAAAIAESYSLQQQQQ